MRSLAPKYIEVHLISDAFTYPVNLKDDDVVRPAGFWSHSFSIHESEPRGAHRVQSGFCSVK